MRAWLLLAVFFVLFSCIAHALDITTCQALNAAGTTYRLTANPASVAADCFPVSANNIILDGNGFTIDGDDSGSTDQGVVTSSGVTGFTVKNLIVHDFAECVRLDNTDTSVIQNVTCQSQDQSNNGVLRIVTGSDTNQLINNTIQTGNAPVGIYIDGTVSGTTISGTTCNGLTMACIDINGTATGFIIANNTVNAQNGGGGGVAGGAAGIILSGGSSNTVVNNTVANATAATAGIWAISGSGYTFANNTLSNIAGNGMYLNGMTASSWTGNRYTGMTLAAINISTATTNTFNNEFIYSQTTYISSSTATSSTFTNTTLGYNATVGWANFTSFTLANRNIVENTDINVDPEFVSVDETVAAVLNVTALIKLVSDYNCYEVSAYKAAGFPNSRVNIYNTGSFFITANCTVGANSASFYVQNFSGYALGFSVYLMNSTNYPLGAVSNISSIFYVTFYDESSGAAINIDSATLSFNAWNSGLADAVARNYSINYAGAGTVQNATINAHPNWTWANLSSIESYAKSGYASRTRFMNFANTSLSTLQNISVYLLSLSEASYGIITVVNRGEPVDGAYVRILKYFSSSSSYTVVDEKVTNNQGQAASYIDPIAYYKFLVLDANGNQLYLSPAPEQFICDSTCKIVISIGNQVPTHWITPYASASCYGNASANSIIYAYNDATGFTSTITFLAWRGNNTSAVVNYTTAAASAGYIANLSAPENLSAYVYTCAVQRTASPPWYAFVGQIDLRTFIPHMADFPFVALIAVIAPAAMGILIHPAFGVAGAVIGLFGAQILGITNLPETAMAGIIAVGAVLAFLFVRDDNG